MLLPDPTSKQLFSKEAREENQVFLVSREYRSKLMAFRDANEDNICYIHSHEELDNELSRRSPFNIKKHTASVIRFIKSLEVGVKTSGDFSTGLTISSNINKFSSSSNKDDILIIKQNKISSGQFAKLFDMYIDTPIERQPLFIVEADRYVESLRRQLRQCSGKLRIVEISARQNLQKFVGGGQGAESINEFLTLFSEGVFSPAGGTEISRLSDQANVGPAEGLALDFMRLRAQSLTRPKFEIIDDVRLISSKVKQCFEAHTDDRIRKSLLVIKAMANLWELYCTESTERLLQNSLAIAENLNDRLLAAHCFRYINVIRDPSQDAKHFLNKAIEVFNYFEQYDHAFLCINNKLVNGFHIDEPQSPSLFNELLAQVNEASPGLRGVSIILNNAGVSMMIDNKFEDALTFFQNGQRSAGLTLHRSGMIVNKMIVEYMIGKNFSDEDLVATARSILRTVDPRYRFHIATMLLNLRQLASSRSEAERFLEGVFSAAELGKEASVLASRSLMPVLKHFLLPTKAHSCYGGPRGRFIERHGFVPIIHFAWL